MFFIFFSIVKKIKIIGNIIFLCLFHKNNIINIVLKNIKIKIKPFLIGLYCFIHEKQYYIIEICYYKKTINKINNFYNFKSNFIYYIRFYFFYLNFFELDVPLIIEYSISGSKQFLVINKKKKNEFFSLSQSPQCIKQYYMFNNINKYFKIINCFRDEDERTNRVKEFLQLDLEISFSNFLEIKKIIKTLLNSMLFYFLIKKSYYLTTKFNNIKKFFFEKKNFKRPYIFVKIKNIVFILYIFKTIIKKIKMKNFFFKFNKYVIIIVKKVIDFSISFCFDFYIKYYNLINLKYIFFWYVNYNYYKKKKPKHHFFTSYKNFFKNIKYSKSLSYDLNINGVEIGGGSIRNINYNIQKKNFFYLNEKKSKFINFYKKSIPQHCGIAIGIERLISNILNINIDKTILYSQFKKYIKSVNIYDI